MRVISSTAEMRNQYHYAEFRQEQEQLRIQPTAPPPLQRSSTTRSQSNKQHNLPTGNRDSALDELTASLINILLARLTGIQPRVISLVEFTSGMKKQASSAETWQDLADSIQDILLPAQYPQQNFVQGSVSLPLQIQLVTNDEVSTFINAEIKLSALWMLHMSRLDQQGPVDEIETIVIRLNSDHLDLSDTNISLGLNIDMAADLSHPTEEHRIFSRLQIWGNDGPNSHRLLAIGQEGFSVVYLSRLQTTFFLAKKNYLAPYGKIIKREIIDLFV